MRVIDAAEVRERLDYASCIGLMREAMIALAQGRTQQHLRSIIDLGEGDLFGLMPGAMDGAGFGAKILSVFPNAPRSHQGVILLFDRETGAPACVIDAGEVTAIRTACASAAATDALALPEASRLAILGTGEQAWQHAIAIGHVRPLSKIYVWGKNPYKASSMAEKIAAELGIETIATLSASDAAADADIVCTTTAASEPVLFSADIADGTHINVIGSSRPGPVEIDNALVARARFIPDHRDGVLVQGAEYLAAKAAGLIGEDHLLPEIGHVFAGTAPGRISAGDVTIYKSLGSIVQDLACAAFLRGE